MTLSVGAGLTQRSRLVLLPSCGRRAVVTRFLWQLGIQLPSPPTREQVKAALGSAWPCWSAKEIEQTNARRAFLLPGGRVGGVCPDRPGLPPTPIRPGAADPH